MSALFWATYVVLWLLVAIIAVGVLALYHHFGQMYLNSRDGRAEQGPKIGEAFAHDETTDLDGRPLALPAAGQPSLVLFASTTCPICDQLRDHVRRIGHERPDVRVVVFCQGDEEAVAEWAGDLTALARVVVDPRGRHALRHNVAGTPFCVAIGKDGTVRGRAIVNGYERLSFLADEAGGALADTSTRM